MCSRTLKRAPESLAARIAEIPGVADVRTRIVTQVTLDVPGLDEPATGRLVSIPEQPRADAERPALRPGATSSPDATTRSSRATRLRRPTACASATASAR